MFSDPEKFNATEIFQLRFLKEQRQVLQCENLSIRYSTCMYEAPRNWDSALGKGFSRMIRSTLRPWDLDAPLKICAMQVGFLVDPAT